MPRKYNNDDLFISDSGVTTFNKKIRITFFVFLCRALSIVLAILGILCFWKGTF